MIRKGYIRMKIIRVKDYEELSKYAAKYISKKVQKKPNMVLGLATGGTSEGTYQNMINDYKENHTSYQEITTFNLDEYIGLDGNNEKSYRFFMDTHLFNHLDIDKTKTFIPRGNVKDPLEECKTYELLIKEHGGIELQLLGIGGNGHIGFNEPGSSFQSRTQIVELADSTRRANARFFERLEDVPTLAITMGIATIMESEEILLLASGEGKREALKRLLQGEVSEDFPASILNKHSNVTIIADEAALSGIK